MLIASAGPAGTSLASAARQRACVALAWSALALALAASEPVNAICVATAAQLQDALTAASDGGAHAADDYFIFIEQGTYTTGSATGNGPFHAASSAATGRLTLSGGWDHGCVNLTRNSELTILGGQHATQVLSLRRKTGVISVSGLTIQNGESTLDGGGLSINHVSGDDSAADVEDNIIRGNHTTGHGGGVSITSTDDYGLALYGNVIVDNSADLGAGAGEIVCNGGIAGISNNTVSKNTTTLVGGIGGGLYYGGSGVTAFISNNIFWANTTYGIYVAVSGAHLDYNDIGTAGGMTPTESTGNLSLTPQFIDAANGDFHLSAASPLIGASLEPSALVDPDGNSGPTRGSTDMGAYFETVFEHGFDRE